MIRSCTRLLAPWLLAGLAPLAAQDMAEVTIQTVKVAPGVYMLAGQGGNIGLSVGGDGAFLIDDQFAPLTPKILGAVAEVSQRPVRILLNTHWHGDHTGGNENLGRAGALLVAHENVRRRMSEGQLRDAFGRQVPPAPEGALPVVTFTDAMTFHWNDDELRVFHVEHAHTDGDAIVQFRRANVVHMGDVYFNGIYPFIDADSGGSIDGVIAAVELVLGFTDEQTRFIPGHGPVSGAEDLRAYRAMLGTVRDDLRRRLDAGQGREEILAAHPTRAFDAEWGDGFLEPDRWVGLVLDGMTATRH